MPDHPGALGDPLTDVDQLDLVGVDDVDIGVGVGQRGDRDAAALGLRQVGGQLVTHLTLSIGAKSPRFFDRRSCAVGRAIL